VTRLNNAELADLLCKEDTYVGHYRLLEDVATGDELSLDVETGKVRRARNGDRRFAVAMANHLAGGLIPIAASAETLYTTVPAVVARSPEEV
jgi:hypothetical protein